jgi:hypothetical protein
MGQMVLKIPPKGNYCFFRWLTKFVDYKLILFTIGYTLIDLLVGYIPLKILDASFNVHGLGKGKKL